MGVLITINNDYNNGVCGQHTIYTGTTYNIDNAVSVGTHTLPYSWDAGSYVGNLYVFIEHCDSHLDPPPSENPKKQGGFQVRLLTIDCEQCPPMTTPEPIDCNMSISIVEMYIDCDLEATFQEYIDTDCDLEATFQEYIDTDCDMEVNFVEYNTPTPNPTSTPNATPNPTPNPTADCVMEGTVEEYFG